MASQDDRLCNQCTELKKIFTEYRSSIRDVYSVEFCDKLVECDVITRPRDGPHTYDHTIEQFFATMDLSSASDMDELEKCCQYFLSALLSTGSKKAIELSRELRKKLNSKATEIGLPSSFLSKETRKYMNLIICVYI